jgi:hypothetical protein
MAFGSKTPDFILLKRKFQDLLYFFTHIFCRLHLGIGFRWFFASNLNFGLIGGDIGKMLLGLIGS